MIVSEEDVFVKKNLYLGLNATCFMYGVIDKPIKYLDDVTPFLKSRYLVIRNLAQDIIDGGPDRPYLTSKGRDMVALRDKTTDRIVKSLRTIPMTTECFILDLISIGGFYVVGGFIRDAIGERTSKDIDFCSGHDIESLIPIFNKKGYKTKLTGVHYKVLMVSGRSTNFEISSFRKDSVSTDGRRPDKVDVGSIYDDAFRRDFYCNSLYYSLDTESVIDITGKGIFDCWNKEINFIGVASDRICEDYLRVFRGYRFASMGYTIGKKTLKAMRQYFEAACEVTDPQRIRTELERIVFKNAD